MIGRMRFTRVILIVILSGHLLLACNSCEAQTDRSISDLLPEPEETNGWQKASDPLLYRGEALYDYINGGAEVFFDHGFKQVLVQEYIRGDRRIILDIYEMVSSDGAKGIFSSRISDSDQQIPIGKDGRLSDYYLISYRGPYFIAVTGLDTTSEIVQGIRSIAQAVDERIKAQ